MATVGKNEKAGTHMMAKTTCSLGLTTKLRLFLSRTVKKKKKIILSKKGKTSQRLPQLDMNYQKIP